MAPPIPTNRTGHKPGVAGPEASYWVGRSLALPAL